MTGLSALRDLGPVDVAALADAVRCLPEPDWDADAFRQQRFDVHARTRSIRWVWTSLDTWPVLQPRELPALRGFEDLLAPVFVCVARSFGRPLSLMNAVVARLDPGGEIAPHVDSAPFFAVAHRVHVPLLTNPASRLEVDGVAWNLPVGRAWELDNQRRHAAWNHGDAPRVHLIVDVMAT
jgi:hypothetical protein